MKAILLILLSGIFLQGMGENRQLYIITDSKQVAEAEKASVTIPEDVVRIFDSSENTIKVCSDYDTTERFGYCRRQGFERQKFQPCTNAQ